MVDAGLIVIVGLISPFKKERDWARGLIQRQSVQRNLYLNFFTRM
jgi:adenylylsulfate kinase-like enzyme